MARSSVLARRLESLAAFVRRRTGRAVRSKEGVSDLVQSTFREYLRGGGPASDLDAEAERMWLRHLAECKIKNRARHWRAQRRDAGREVGEAAEGAPPAVSAEPDPGSQAALAELVETLERAYAALPEEHRSAIRLARVEGLTHAEIAARLGKSEEASRKLLSRALARLGTEMERQSPAAP